MWSSNSDLSKEVALTTNLGHFTLYTFLQGLPSVNQQDQKRELFFSHRKNHGEYDLLCGIVMSASWRQDSHPNQMQ